MKPVFEHDNDCFQIQNADSVGSLSPIIDWRDDEALDMSVINIVTWDRAGLFLN